MTTLALKGFAALRPHRLVVCNRDAAKARNLALKFGGVGSGTDALDEQLGHADIVITSTGATRPIIRRAPFESILKRRASRPIFLLDIAVPRDIEPSVGSLDQVHLCNLDDLQRGLDETQSLRAGALSAARLIVERHVDDFIVSQRQREIGPAIDLLYRKYHEIAAEEVGRAADRNPNIGDIERSQLEELARRIVNKLLHDPVRTLRERLHADASSPDLHAIQRIFRLGDISNATQNEGHKPDEPTDQRPHGAAG